MLFEAQDFKSPIKVWNHIEKKSLATDMIFVEGGTFEMGSKDEADNAPLHTVTLSSFYISKHQVTQEEYFSIIGKVHKKWLGNNFPEFFVSWIEAVIFCDKASVAEGFTPCYTVKDSKVECDWDANGYRLPTEAEWEYAARGGIKNDGTIYSGSDNIDEVAWYYDNSGKKLHEVMTKKPNGLGIYDMGSNIHEFCYDYYGNYPESSIPQNNPCGPKSGDSRVVRGCCYGCDKSCARVFNRYTPAQQRVQEWWYGFRLVRTKL